TQASHFVKRTEVYSGFEITLTSRFARGGQFSGGLTVGRSVTDACQIVKKRTRTLVFCGQCRGSKPTGSYRGSYISRHVDFRHSRLLEPRPILSCGPALVRRNAGQIPRRISVAVEFPD